jgi:hypothetical protein
LGADWKKPGRLISRRLQKKTLCAEVRQVEVNNDVAFPMIDLKTQLETGFSRREGDPVMQSLMHDMVLGSLC